MHAYVCLRYGGLEVLRYVEVPTPLPQAHEVLVRIRATTVTSGDWRVRTLNVPKGLGMIARLMLGLSRPRQPILGSELAGVVEAVGTHVTRFRPGDAVLAFPGAQMGCHAQYRAVAEDGPIAMKPETLSFEEAASLPFGGTTALHFLRKAKLQAGERILVVGAAGCVGSMLMQLAIHMGARVTGVAGPSNRALVKCLGAENVIDYTEQDVTEITETFDVIADTVGAVPPARYRKVLAENGRLLAIAAGLPDMLASVCKPLAGGVKVIAGPAEERPQDVHLLAELAGSGALRPVIGRRFAFAQLAQAHAYVETGHKRGSAVVTVL